MPSIKITKRVRIFAGPNGSGKSTIINSIRKIKVKNRPIDFGIYVNADDIAKHLREGKFRFSDYKLQVITRSELLTFSLSSGLIGRGFTETELRKSFSLKDEDLVQLNVMSADERLAQILAAFLRTKLLENGQKFSFETVFSHKSKVEFMQKAKSMGYKVYFYFVSTESPTINISRIKEIRVKDGGHDVPEQKIKDRYERTMGLLYDAAQYAYKCYFFDNSTADKNPKPFAHFRVVGEEKVWDDESFEAPEWFLEHYSSKVKNTGK